MDDAAEVHPAEGLIVETGAALWRVLAEHWNLHDIPPAWSQLLAADFTAVGRLLTPAGRATSWVCGFERDGCRRRLDRQDGRCVAVCGSDDSDCGDEPVDPAAAHIYRHDVAALLREIRASIGTESDDLAEPLGVSRLGRRRFGDTEARFYFSREATRAALDAIGAHEAGEVEGVAVLLTPAAPAASLLQLAGSRDLTWLSLARVASIGVEGVEVDLDDFLAERRFDGLDPSAALSRRKRLILHPQAGRLWWDANADGRRVEVEFSLKAAVQWALASALVARAGREVSRSVLLPVVYGSAYNELSRSQEWDKKLRQVKDDLDERVRLPIVTHEGGKLDGGFELRLQPGEIAWWSDLPSAPRGKKPTNRRKK